MRRAAVGGFLRLRDQRRVRVPKSAATHRGFRRWVTTLRFPEHVHPTFVDGEMWFTMSPESLETHSKVKTEFTSVLAAHVRDRDLGEVYADGALFTNIAARVSTEPDLQFISWAASESGRVTLTRRKQRREEFIEIVGTPDLVLEVVSDSSTRKDLVRLKAAYERAGVPEYWLADARAERIAFQILTRQDGVYRASADADRPQRSGVLGARFELRWARNRVGRFTCTLAVD
jgi:Uma2 family endonuclease